MNSNVEAPHAALDTVKLALAVILLVGGLASFYVLGDLPKLTRVFGLIGAVGIAIAIALQTDKGRAISAFVGDAQVEVRKVVWPTRKETVNTTLAVMVVVILAALILWLLDMVLGVLMRYLMGQGG
ncbi:MAG: preprotein translocase subunit SecE [Gammaproteobacteria bacterium]|nr:preprotein translocase subunit SecE [Gammaproteobacteria bacterium]